MEDIASLLFIFGGALSYPLFLHLSLKKSLSFVTKGSVEGKKAFSCLFAVHFEAVLLMIPTALVGLPGSSLYFYIPTAIILPLIVFVASYTIKAMFHIPFKKAIFAFLLWQGLSVTLGGLFIGTGAALMYQPSLVLPSITVLAFLAWWVWLRKRGKKDEWEEMEEAAPEKKAAVFALIVLFCSSLLTHSMVGFVYCGPEDWNEQEIEFGFTWNGNPVRATIAWNATQTNATESIEVVGKEQPNPFVEFGQGAVEGGIDFVKGIVNVSGTISNLHDVQREMTYASLINDITQIQNIIITQQDHSANPTHNSQGSSEPILTIYTKDQEQAGKLASMDRKGFKLAVVGR